MFVIAAMFLSLKRQPSNEPWIVAVKQVTYQLTKISATATYEDIIVVLTLGLPNLYENFVITLDSTPFYQLTLDYIQLNYLMKNPTKPACSQVEHGLTVTMKHRCYDAESMATSRPISPRGELKTQPPMRICHREVHKM